MKIFGDDLNNYELLRGALISLLLTPLCGVWVLLILPCSAYFYALSGCQGHGKVWRRLCCPLSNALGCAAHFKCAWMLAAVAPAYGALCSGYGWPSTQPPDAGSWLGRYVKKELTDNPTWGPLVAHLIILCLVWVSFYGMAYIWTR